MRTLGFRRRFAISVLLLAAFAATSKADTIYNNSAQWIAATSGVTAINFGALSPPIGSYITYATPPGLTTSGVNFSSTGSDIYDVSENYCCSTYARDVYKRQTLRSSACVGADASSFANTAFSSLASLSSFTVSATSDFCRSIFIRR